MGDPRRIGGRRELRETGANWLPRSGGVGPLLGVVADSGQLTRLAVGAGVDFLLALSAGAYRNQGISALAAFLPYRNSNAPSPPRRGPPAHRHPRSRPRPRPRPSDP
jgi:hypothetical protein